MGKKTYQIAEDKICALHELITEAKRIAIIGHTNPDGDCVGSCVGLCTYILDNYTGKEIDILLEPIPSKFTFLHNTDHIIQKEQDSYDLVIVLDSSDPYRFETYAHLLDACEHSICIDHHFTNKGFGELQIICPDSSSTCEVVYQLLDDAKISTECATALYLGIVHDTGVFKHNNTKRKTMEIAGALLDHDVKPEEIIDGTFYEKTYLQNQILGRALEESIQMLDGRMIFSVLSLKDLNRYNVDPSDLDGIIDQLRVTKGTICAAFLYEKEDGSYKVSLRANGDLDVSAIAMEFGGGGHIKAAGCTVNGEPRDIIMNIAERVELQLGE